MTDYKFSQYTDFKSSCLHADLSLCKQARVAMTIHVSISEASARLSRYIEQTSEENETIRRNAGNPKAVLIPYRSFEEFSTWQEAQHRKQ
ncbi:MAG: type II toxin-antitoxin system Phd/YefM family antitoxin [Caldilineaceae bacterium]